MNRPMALLVVAALFALTACEKETLGTKIDDAMEKRPAEGLQDGVEDLKDKVKDATN